LPDSFLVEVSPTFSQNESVDLKITAIKNGAPYLQYTGNVGFSIEGLRPSEYTLPSIGWYFFTPEDQGTKTFSKGLTVRRTGTFTLVVEDVTQVAS